MIERFRSESCAANVISFTRARPHARAARHVSVARTQAAQPPDNAAAACRVLRVVRRRDSNYESPPWSERMTSKPASRSQR